MDVDLVVDPAPDLIEQFVHEVRAGFTRMQCTYAKRSRMRARPI
jgi:hypothetical protein